MRSIRFAAVFVGLWVLAFATPAAPGGKECSSRPRQPIGFVDVPGRPFGVVPTPDGCWLFVAFNDAATPPAHGLAVLRWGAGELLMSRVVPLAIRPTGMTMTHDGEMLAVAAGNQVTLLDVDRVLSGDANPVLGSIGDSLSRSYIYVAVTQDGTLLFASDETTSSITVFDLSAARQGHFGPNAVIGRIPVGQYPVGLALSPDQRLLFGTSQVADEPAWPLACPFAGQDLARREGSLEVIDVEKARSDPANARMSVAPAGCSPVRVASAPHGDGVWVSARGDDAVLAFDTARLLSDPATALVGRVPVGRSPVGIAVFAQGRRVVVANSNRFAPDPLQPQTLTVIDATRPTAGSDAHLATLPAGAFPREMAVAPDRRTLFVTNYLSGQVEVVDLIPYFGQGFQSPDR